MKQGLVLRTRHLVVGASLAALFALAPMVPQAVADDLKPLPIKYPEPTLRGTPEDLPASEFIEPPPKPEEAPKPFLAPADAQNVAQGKPVTSSVKPFTGELAQVVDGKKEAFDSDAIEMRSGSQWIQIDLGAPTKIYAVAMWHDHRYIQITRDVIVQVADDAEFTKNVRTVYNNDRDDSSKQGAGTDKEYFETKHGRVADAKGIVARYVRGYSKGTSLTGLNCWQEVEVWGVPAK